MNVVVVRHHVEFVFFFLSIPLYEHLDISPAITAESLPLHIASDRLEWGIVGFRVYVAKH